MYLETNRSEGFPNKLHMSINKTHNGRAIVEVQSGIGHSVCATLEGASVNQLIAQTHDLTAAKHKFKTRVSSQGLKMCTKLKIYIHWNGTAQDCFWSFILVHRYLQLLRCMITCN